MPPIDQHLASSRERTGSDYREVHRWLDADPEKKAERHDITRIYEYGRLIEAEYGAEAVQEYLRHIEDDVRGMFNHVMADIDGRVKAALAYFGVKY